MWGFVVEVRFSWVGDVGVFSGAVRTREGFRDEKIEISSGFYYVNQPEN